MGAPALVSFECVAPTHQPGTSHPDKLTIHEGHWAFCPFDARADGHSWKATGGADMNSLLHRVGLAAATSAADAATDRQAPKR
jgi:hypothetical protein